MRLEFANRPVAGIVEKQIDIFLVEELTVNPAFSKWVFERCNVNNQPSQVRNSVWHDEKEIGVLCVTKFPPIGIMIENKITAPLSSEQIQGYHDVGRGQVIKGFWSDYRVLVVAPKSWIEYHQPQDVHVTISYEDIIDFLRMHHDPRLDWRASVFQQAAKIHRSARKNSGNNYLQKGRGRDSLRAAAITEAITLMESPNPPSGRKGEFSIKDVARAIGTSAATIHNLFGTLNGLMTYVQISVYKNVTRRILESMSNLEECSPAKMLAEVFFESAEMIYLSSRTVELQNTDRDQMERSEIDLTDAVSACVKSAFPQVENDIGKHILVGLLGASKLAANDAYGLNADWRSVMERMVMDMVQAHDQIIPSN